MITFDFLFAISVTAATTILVLYFIQKPFKRRFAKKIHWLVFAAAEAVYLGINIAYLFYPPTALIDMLLLHLFYSLYAVLSLKGFWYHKIFWSSLLTGILGIFSFICNNFFELISGNHLTPFIISHTTQRTIYFIVCLILMYIILYYFSKIHFVSRFIQTKDYIAMMSLPILCNFVTVILFSVKWHTGAEFNSLATTYLILFGVIVLALIMITYYLYYKISTQGEAILKTQSELQHRNLMEQHNEELLTLESNMRSWRHDFHNHLQTLSLLSDSDDKNAMKDYITQMGQHLEKIVGICHTGRQTLDAIVSVKSELAQLDEITVDIKATPIPPLPINDVDATSLLGNLFDNAIESCRKLDVNERRVSLFLGTVASMIRIRMENATDGTGRSEGGRFLTTKNGDGLHGLGLSNIDRIVEEAGGMIEREHKDGVFVTDILLPLSHHET